jgi:hypothetical protein
MYHGVTVTVLIVLVLRSILQYSSSTIPWIMSCSRTKMWCSHLLRLILGIHGCVGEESCGRKTRKDDWSMTSTSRQFEHSTISGHRKQRVMKHQHASCAAVAKVNASVIPWLVESGGYETNLPLLLCGCDFWPECRISVTFYTSEVHYMADTWFTAHVKIQILDSFYMNSTIYIRVFSSEYSGSTW